MKSRYIFVWLGLCCTGLVQAEIYKSVDAEGHVTYSSTPSRGAKILGLDKPAPSATVTLDHKSHSARPVVKGSPGDFPKVDSNTQKNRDSMRRKILEDELAVENKLLTEARTNLLQDEAAHNMGRSDVKRNELQQEVTMHEKNVSALKTELSNVK